MLNARDYFLYSLWHVWIFFITEFCHFFSSKEDTTNVAEGIPLPSSDLESSFTSTVSHSSQKESDLKTFSAIVQVH